MYQYTYKEPLQINYYITFVLLCLYLLFVNILLINLLIAIFSNTYADSEAKSGG